jgi:hypothetical protein
MSSSGPLTSAIRQIHKLIVRVRFSSPALTQRPRSETVSLAWALLVIVASEGLVPLACGDVGSVAGLAEVGERPGALGINVSVRSIVVRH